MTHPNPSVALARVLADELARLGIEHACLAPGSRSTSLAMALHDHERITLHVGIDERSVAFLALGIARTSRQPVAVLSTSGTAAVNFHPAVVEAHEAGVPLVVLTADRPPELRHSGANQTIDQIKLYGDSVRLFVEVGAAHDIPGANAYWRSTACHAWAAATGHGGRPGPVHLNVAFREPLVPESDDGRDRAEPFAGTTDGRPDGRPWTLPTRPRVDSYRARDTVAERLARRAREARRGLLVVGDTFADPEPLVRLAARLGWPLLAEPQSGARQGPHAVAAYDHLLAADAFAGSHEPDLVIRVGRTALSRSLLGFLSSAVPQVLVDPHGAWVDPTRAVDEIVVADPAALADGLDVADPKVETAWLDAWQEADRRAVAAIGEILDAEDTPTEPRAARDLAAALPDGALLVAASSMPIRDLDRFMVPRAGLRVVSNRGASGIDGFVSTAVGAAITGPEPTAALAGDLSLLHDRNGFLLLDERPDLVLVVVNNDGGGIFSFLPQARYGADFERLFGTPHGIDPARVAAVHGLDHVRVERASELGEQVRSGLRDGGIRLLEIRTDRRGNADLHRRLRDAVARAV